MESRSHGAALRLSEIPFGAFRQIFAVCCAQNLFAVSEQILHLQPEKYFLPGTRPGRKRFAIPISLPPVGGKLCEGLL